MDKANEYFQTVTEALRDHFGSAFKGGTFLCVQRDEAKLIYVGADLDENQRGMFYAAHLDPLTNEVEIVVEPVADREAARLAVGNSVFTRYMRLPRARDLEVWREPKKPKPWESIEPTTPAEKIAKDFLRGLMTEAEYEEELQELSGPEAVISEELKSFVGLYREELNRE